MKEKIAFSITALSRVSLTYEYGESTSKVEDVNLKLEISNGVLRESFFDENGDPNEPGMRALDNALIAGLGISITMGDQKGWISRKEHVKKLIERLNEAVEQMDGSKIIPGQW